MPLARVVVALASAAVVWYHLHRGFWRSIFLQHSSDLSLDRKEPTYHLVMWETYGALYHIVRILQECLHWLAWCRSRQLAREEGQTALAALSCLPDTPSKRSLVRMVDYVLDRLY